MRGSVPGLAQRARLLLHSADAVPGCIGSSSSASAVVSSAAARQQQAAFTGTTRRTPPPPGTKPKEPAAASPAAAASASPAATAAAAPGTPPSAAQPGPAAASTSSTPSGSVGGSSTAGGTTAGGGSKKQGGGGWGLPLVVLGCAGAAYAAYETSKSKYQTTVDSSSSSRGSSRAAAENLQQQLSSLLEKGKEAASSVSGMLPADLLNKVRGVTSSSSKSSSDAAVASSSSSSNDKLLAQKQVDAEDSGFKILPPEAAVAAAETAAADAAAAASAAARDAMSAAADEFPGSSDAAAGSTRRTTAGVVDMSTARTEEIDMTPINALFAEVAVTDLTAPVPSTPEASPGPSSSSRRAVAVSDESAAGLVSKVAAVAAAQRQQGVGAAPAAPPGQSDQEVDSLRKRLGLPQDLSPSGLIAAANSAGLGAYSSSSGAPLPPQMAQLNQATADSRAVAQLLQQLAAQQAALQQQLAAVHQEKEWTAAEAQKREESLTEHFKELLREQARIQQALTAQAVREAEEAVMADTAAAHLQERRERLAAVDDLRSSVNALTLAFNKRTAEVKSAHEVHKVHLGALALSRALEQGRAIGPQLQHLAAGCPGDPVVEAVAASLPVSASSAGLPTHRELQQSFATVAQRAAEAAYFTDQDAGGVVAHLLAKLAVKLKVDVPDAEGPDAKIAQARALLQEGKLLAAADAMSAAAAGSQAADLVQAWVQDARARAVADQAVKLLQAYATTTAAARA